jgi:hypothetical protein
VQQSKHQTNEAFRRYSEPDNRFQLAQIQKKKSRKQNEKSDYLQRGLQRIAKLKYETDCIARIYIVCVDSCRILMRVYLED